MVRTDEVSIDRRKLMVALGTGAVTGLAGCGSNEEGNGGDDDGGSDDSSNGNGDSSGGSQVGERVEPVVVEYWTGATYTPEAEACAPIIQDSIRELGVRVELQPKNVGTSIGEHYNDQRTSNIGMWFLQPDVQRLGPQYLLDHIGAPDGAGASGSSNAVNWVNCDFAEALEAQAEAPTVERRQEIVDTCQQIAGDEKVSIQLMNSVTFGLVNSDAVNVQSLGEMGANEGNTQFLINSEPSGDYISLPTQEVSLESKKWTTTNTVPARQVWTGLVHTPLFYYNENFEVIEGVAKEYSVSDDGTQVEVSLLDDDVLFHNGDVLTTEDVQYTYHYIRDNQDLMPYVSVPESLEVEIIDDKNFNFNFDEPFPGIEVYAMHMYGILHSESWREGGAESDPEGFEPDPVIGSGPWQVDSLTRGQSLVLEPHDGHPLYQPDHGLILNAYASDQAKFEAVRQGDLDVGSYLGSSQFDQVVNEDRFTAAVSVNYVPWVLYPQWAFGPTKFTEFRDAIGKVLNRQEMVDVATYGESNVQLHCSQFIEPHPFRTESDEEFLYKFTDDPTGDVDAARSALEEAGWTWDNNGNLHYPTDADISPRWPEGEDPSPEEFPCLEG